jgi:protease-4
VRSTFRFAYNLMRLLTWPVWALWWRLRRQRGRWVVLQLRGAVDELPRPQKRVLRLLSGMRAPRRSVADIRRLCERIGGDPHAQGLLLRLERLDAGYATLASLRTELARLRQRGKEVVCYLPLEASQRELYVAAAASRVFAMPHAGFTVLGPLASRTYVATLLARLGIGVVVTAEGRFKSAADSLVRSAMSEPEREQLTAIVRVLHDDWVAALGAREQLGVAGAARLFQVGLFGALRARELGAIDACLYDDELLTQLGLDEREKPLALEGYLSRGAPLGRLWPRAQKKERVAIVRLVGAISERGGGATNPGIDLHGTVAALRAVAAARHITGVILYIDSPGGSAVVSELLHREIARLDRKKPVVTWMGNVAASGGYYLASATRSIIAQPTTLTGSIGVISVRPVAGALFAKLGLQREAVSLTPFADLHGLSHAPSAAEEALLHAETARFYSRFLEVVAQGRKRSSAQIAEHAEGRVWTGRDAHAVGLVDVLGGYYEAREQLDRLDGSVTRSADVEPVLVTPMQRATPALPPLREPLDPVPGAGLGVLASAASCGPRSDDVQQALAQLRELWGLAMTGE